MAGDLSGGDTVLLLSRRPPPRPHWRGTSRHRIGPLRTVAEAADHPILSGIRSGAISGLIIVAVLGLPVLLILGAKTPPPSAFEPSARVWVAGTEAEAPVRAWAEPMPAPVLSAAAAPIPAPLPTPLSASLPASLPEPPRGRVAEGRPPLSLDLIPVLDDESGVLALEELPVPDARPARSGRPTAQRASRTP